MSPLLVGKEVGTERISYEVLTLMINNINTALATEDAKWLTLDQSLSTLLGINFVQCVSNQIQKPNFFLGHRPSLIEAPVENYPNLAVMADVAIPSSDIGDHWEGFNVRLFIEGMVIDGPYTDLTEGYVRTGEDLCNKKAQRMMEAIHNIMITNRTLNGIIEEINETPRVFLSNCFVRSEDTSSGSEFYWQMLRLEYNIRKVATYQ